MLSRDFVYAFLTGQVQAGIGEEEAKTNFVSWLSGQSEAIASSAEKEQIVADLNSYNVKV